MKDIRHLIEFSDLLVCFDHLFVKCASYSSSFNVSFISKSNLAIQIPIASAVFDVPGVFHTGTCGEPLVTAVTSLYRLHRAQCAIKQTQVTVQKIGREIEEKLRCTSTSNELVSLIV